MVKVVPIMFVLLNDEFISMPKSSVCALSIAVGLPFAVEESKKSKTNSKTNNFDLGELIMDLSNGSRSANLRTGSIKLKTGNLAASNYTLEQMEERYIYLHALIRHLFHMFCFYRVRSRSLCVKFSLPSTGPTTSQEFQAFNEFKSGMKEGKYTSAIGWVVGLREKFLCEGKYYVQSKQQEIRDRVRTYTICRNTTGWASTLFFLEKVSSNRFPSLRCINVENPTVCHPG